MPVIRQVFDQISRINNIYILFVQPNDHNIQEISKFLEGSDFKYSFSTERLKSFAVSDCVLAKSGTNNLEITASFTPQIIGYKLNIISFFLLKLMIKIKYASIINILANREIIPEYIQSEYNTENIVTAISSLLNDKKRAKSQVLKAQEFLMKIGFKSKIKPSNKAAQIILNMLK